MYKDVPDPLCDPLRDKNFGDSIAPCDFTPTRNGSRVADAYHVMTYTRRIDCAREKIPITGSRTRYFEA